MHVHRIKKSFLDVQKCILPSSAWNETSMLSANQYVFITVSESYKILAKLQRCSEPALSYSCFLDFCVILPGMPWESFDFSVREAHYSSLMQEHILPALSVNMTPSIEITIVVTSASSLQKFKTQTAKLTPLIQDLLKLFSFSKNSLIFLENVLKPISLDIHCIAIENLSGKKDSVYTVGDKTTVLIKDIYSFSMLQQKQALLKNLMWDRLFFSPDKTRLQNVTNSILEVLKIAHSYDTFPLRAVCTKNLLIVGTHGCGKTSIVEAAARHSGFITLLINCGDLSSAPVNSAKKKLKTIFTDACIHAENEEPCVILLKDIDLLTVKKNEAITRPSQILINEMYQIMEKLKKISNTAVIGTSNSPEDISGSLRRFDGLVDGLEIPILAEDDREYVLKTIAECFRVPCDIRVPKEVAKWTPGFVLADLMAVVKESRGFLQKENDQNTSTQLKCYKKAVSITTATAIKGTRGLVTSNKTFFSDIGGLETIKKQLRMSVQWPLTEPEAFARLGIPLTKGILLFGPPGCAKTMLVKALACECNTTFLAVSSADLYSPYVGESEKRLVKLFMQARIAAPAIIFIDEIDGLVGNKDSGRERGVQERILATLLIEMDGVGRHVVTMDSLSKMLEGASSQPSSVNKPKSSSVNHSGVIVIGATNRPELIDEALKRPGRFDRLIHVPPPDLSERLAILRTVTKRMQVDKNIDIVSIAARTEMYSGADLKSLCNESALYALTARGMETDCVTSGDFDVVLKSLRKSLTLEMIESYK